MKLFETKKSRIEQLDNSIIRVEIKPDIIMEAADLEENFRIYKEELKIERGLFLLIFNPGGEVDSDTRIKYANSERSKMKIAEAIVIGTLAHRLGANFYKNKYKPTHPVKVFTDEKEATDWLLSFQA